VSHNSLFTLGLIELAVNGATLAMGRQYSALPRPAWGWAILAIGMKSASDFILYIGLGMLTVTVGFATEVYFSILALGELLLFAGFIHLFYPRIPRGTVIALAIGGTLASTAAVLLSLVG